jgi:flavin reductase (DIM6/NTAB) family NADH-FMN oxidoreductase RutF
MTDTRPFDRIADGLDAPMYVVSAADGTDRDACLVGFTTQCSIDPARFLVCLSVANRTFEIAERAGTLVVHLLRAGDEATARHFGALTGDEVDKLADVSWREGPGGAPVIDGLDWFSGRVRKRVPFGDHVGMVLEVDDSGVARRTGDALGYQSVDDVEAGQVP